MMRVPSTGKYIVSIMVVSVVLLVLDIVFFGLSIARSPSDLHEGGTTVYSVYWLGLPLLATAIVGIIAGARKQKALVIAFMVLSILTCVLAASAVILFLFIRYILCGTFGKSRRSGRDGQTCDIQDPVNIMYFAMVSDAVLIFICCLIGSIFACYRTCSCCGSPGTRDEPEVITLTPLSTKHPEDPFIHSM